MKEIIEIANGLNLTKDDIDLYGKYKAKINLKNEDIKKENGKLILVTSTNPTPFGEGKTTLTIGLNDSLNYLGKSSIAVLREPSLGPFFGKKGGATGGGEATVEPSLDINLHFNSDFHAITSANNLLCAIIDNHIYEGNSLEIDKVVFKRCIDINDRELRHISLSKREESFNITPASEIMAILCLSENIEDLKRRLGNIIVGYKKDGKEVLAKELNCIDALTLLLKEAIKPNLVQSKYNSPVLIHGGPFANIAHGCNSVIATKLALKLAHYTIVEAGFGSDMGALKFFDIKCRNHNIYPDAVIINTTIKSLKYNGDSDLEKGLVNLQFHIENMKKFNSNIIVSLNKYSSDLEEEINIIENYCDLLGIDFVISEMYEKGNIGCITLANKIISLKENVIQHTIYNLEDSLTNKIEKVSKYLGCNKLEYDKSIEDKLEQFNKYKLPICIAKTPYSISDDSKKLGYPKDFKMKITDIEIQNGSEFIVIKMGNVLTLPGLSKDANYLKVKDI